MLKLATIVLLFLTLVAGAACSSGEKAAENAAAPSPSPAAMVTYGKGFFPQESTPDGLSWRWMEPEGVIRLKNTGREMRLHLAGNAPIDRFPKPPVLKLTLNGQPLDEFTVQTRDVDKEYTIPADKQQGEYSELKITSDRFFVPKEVDKKSTDPRQLAFSLTKLDWDAK
jgi:hypothetical protein